MIKFVLFIIVILRLSFSLADNCKLESKFDVSKQNTSSIEAQKLFQIEEFEKNPTNFCKQNLLMRFINVNKHYLKNPSCGSSAVNELEKKANEIFLTNQTHRESIWDLSLVPTLSNLEYSLSATLRSILPNENIINNPSRYNTDMLSKDNINYSNLESFFEKNINDIDIDLINKRLNQLSTQMNSDFKPQTNQFDLVALCGEFNSKLTVSCSKAVNIILNNYLPSTNSAGLMTNIPSWRKVLTDLKYQKGLSTISLKILDYLKNGSTKESDNIYSDLVNSFMNSGLNQIDSEEAAITTLGVVASGGANTCQRAKYITSTNPDREGINFILFNEKAKSASVGALCLLGSALNVLDFRKISSDQSPYSFPKGVSTKCLYTKPYHFWLAADISNKLATDHGIDKVSASVAAFIAQKGYQLKRDITGNSSGANLKKIFSYSFFDPIHQVIRMDLAFSAAGAKFGVYKNSKKLNVDNGIKRLLMESHKTSMASSVGSVLNVFVPEKYIPQKSLNFLEWTNLFSPNSAYEAVSQD